MMTFRTLALALLATLLAGPVTAATIYLAESDSNGTVYIIDTETGTFQTRDVSPQENPAAIAIYPNTIVMANYPDDGSWEYDLDLNPTGNSWPGSNTWSQMLDGTTDGTNAYSVSWSSDAIIECDSNFTNCAVLFNTGFPSIGITYDPTNDSFWIVNDNAQTVHNFDRSGNELASFTASLGGRNCCLGYDSATDSLWMSTNGGSTMTNIAKDGTIIDQVTISGLTPSNTWGSEVIAGQPLPPPLAVPVNNFYAMLMLALMVLILAPIAIRRIS